MNFDFMYLMNALLLFLLCYFVFAYIIPVIKRRFFFLIVGKLSQAAKFYRRYAVHLRPCDLLAYEKYQLWHFIEKRKGDIRLFA